MIKLSLLFVSVLCLNFAALASEEAMTQAEVGTEQTQVLEQQPVVQKAAVDSEAKVLTVNKSEDQIPLTIDQNKKVAETQPLSARIMMTGIIIAGLLGTAYYFVRKYKFSNTINKSNMQIKVLSQHYLGPKKSLAIVRVAGESILIGVTDSNISMIKSLSLLDDEIPHETAPQNFAAAMTTEDKKSMPAAGATAMAATKTTSTAAMNMDELEEEFSFSGLKDSVSKKLKSMRSI